VVTVTMNLLDVSRHKSQSHKGGVIFRERL
jgi:hypothetical protein